MTAWPQRIAEDLARLRTERPLVHHITNFVVMTDTANLTLALGALPVMAHAAEEVVEVVGQARALVLNLGTLTPARAEAMRLAGHAAAQRRLPIVLDPVGAGGTRLRTETALRLLRDLPVTIVRGNPGEIGALCGAGGAVRGVESEGAPGDLAAVLRNAARTWRAVVAATGARDLVSDGEQVLGVDNGHIWLTAVTGTGCMATAAIAAFAAVESDPLAAAVAGLACFGLAAEQAAAKASGPGTFKATLFDALHALQPEAVARGVRVVHVR